MGYNFRLILILINAAEMLHNVQLFLLSIRCPYLISQLVELQNNINTFTAIVDLSRFNNSCLKSPASTLVDLTFQSRALRSALSA